MGGQRIPFAILVDRKNEYTKDFDKVIMLKNPTNSYLDKISLLLEPPYDQTIFIDADCLIYNNIEHLFDLMPEKGVSCFGKSLLADSKMGWYTLDKLGEYSGRVSKVTSLHGGIIFINNDNITKKVYHDVKNMISKYHEISFCGFKEPADEPVLALAMEVNGLSPIDVLRYEKVLVFYPATRLVIMNMRHGKAACVKQKKYISDISVLHFNNKNTRKDRYQNQVLLLEKNTGYQYFKLRIKEMMYNIKAVYFYFRRCLGDIVLHR